MCIITCCFTFTFTLGPVAVFFKVRKYLLDLTPYAIWHEFFQTTIELREYQFRKNERMFSYKYRGTVLFLELGQGGRDFSMMLFVCVSFCEIVSNTENQFSECVFPYLAL